VWLSYKTKSTWVEGIVTQRLTIDAYVFDKMMVDKWGHVRKKFPFKEVGFRVSTGKQAIWLKREQINALENAVGELEDEIARRKIPEMRGVVLAVQRIQKEGCATVLR